jgi:ribosomal protein S4
MTPLPTISISLFHLIQVKNPFCAYRGLIRMAWSDMNVYNISNRTKPDDNLRKSVFQQKWAAKRDLRAYHAPDVSERQLIDRHWRNQLPMRHMTLREQERAPPIQALSFAELERRLDVALFRAHFCDSLPMAKKAVLMGCVKVNGVKVCC